MNYNISKIFYDVFGVRYNAGYHVPSADELILKGAGYIDKKINGYHKPHEKAASAISGYSTATPAQQAILRKSLLGTPIYEETQLLTLDQNTQLTLPDTTLIDVEQAKKIITTEIQGSTVDGSIKEFINKGDYQVRIRGLIIIRGNLPPVQAIQDVIAMWNINDALTIGNPVLNLVFQISNIVLTNISLPRIEGIPGVQPFQIDALSDVPRELVLKKRTQSG